MSSKMTQSKPAGSLKRGAMRKRAIVLALALGGVLSWAPAYSEDLLAVFALARQNDPTFQAARSELDAVRTSEPQALAGLLPTASFEASNTRTRQDILSSANAVYATGATTYPTKNYTLTVTQPIFRLSSWLGYAQAKAKIRQAAAVYSAAEQDLIMRTATAYLNVLAARDSLGFAQAERAAIKSQLDLAQQRYSSGLLAAVALYDAKARYALKESDVVAAQKELNDQTQALYEITGATITSLKPVREQIPLEAPTPADLDTWVQSAGEKNLVLEGRRQGVDVARQEMQRQRAGHAPSVDLVVTGNKKDTGGSLFGGGSVVQSTDVMVRLSVPIYSGGLTTALTDEAAARYRQAQILMDRDARQVERQTRAAYEGVTSGVTRIRALGESVTAQESARTLKQEGFKSGLQTILAVLDSERDLYAAKRDAAKARYEYLLNRLRLKQAVGTLSDEDLAAVNLTLE